MRGIPIVCHANKRSECKSRTVHSVMLKGAFARVSNDVSAMSAGP
jgi:hypothetical protein